MSEQALNGFDSALAGVDEELHEGAPAALCLVP